VFDVYFRLSLPAGAVGRPEVQSFLRLSADRSALAAALRRLAAETGPGQPGTRGRAMVERLGDHLGDIPDSDIPEVAGALFDVGDELMRAEPEGGPLWTTVDLLLLNRAYRLLRRLKDQDSRFRALREALQGCTSTYTPVDLIATLGQEMSGTSDHPPDPPEQWTVTADQLGSLQQQGLEAIRAAEREGRLLDVPRLLSILRRWQEWGGGEEPRAFATRQVETALGLANFITACARRVSFWSANDRVASHRLVVRLRDVTYFIGDPEGLQHRAAALVAKPPPWLADKMRGALEAFARAKPGDVDEN
jgi:predicted KAP-like P-loop ATPase